MYTVESVIFKATGKSKRIELPREWEFLKKGFLNSSVNLNGKVNLHELDSYDSKRSRKELGVNNHKLKFWRDIVFNADQKLILADTDLCFLDDIEDGFTDKPITLTKRSSRWCNAGVIFIRPCKEARDFMQDWVEMDDYLREGRISKDGNPERLKKAWRETGVQGQNQTSLAKIAHKYNIGWVSGEMYNASQRPEWKGNSKVVHVKDRLREDLIFTLLGNKKPQFKVTKQILPYY